MLIGNNNSVLYIGYLQKVKNEVIPYCFSFFFTPVLRHLQNLLQERNVLHINGEGYAEENKNSYQFGLQGWPLH